MDGCASRAGIFCPRRYPNAHPSRTPRKPGLTWWASARRGVSDLCCSPPWTTAAWPSSTTSKVIYFDNCFCRLHACVSGSRAHTYISQMHEMIRAWAAHLPRRPRHRRRQDKERRGRPWRRRGSSPGVRDRGGVRTLHLQVIPNEHDWDPWHHQELLSKPQLP